MGQQAASQAEGFRDEFGSVSDDARYSPSAVTGQAASHATNSAQDFETRSAAEIDHMGEDIAGAYPHLPPYLARERARALRRRLGSWQHPEHRNARQLNHHLRQPHEFEFINRHRRIMPGSSQYSFQRPWAQEAG